MDLHRIFQLVDANKRKFEDGHYYVGANDIKRAILLDMKVEIGEDLSEGLLGMGELQKRIEQIEADHAQYGVGPR